MKHYLQTTFTLAKTLSRRFVRDKTALFFTFVFPLIFLLVFGGIFGSDDQPSFNVALINNSESEFATQFVNQAKDGEIFEITEITDFEAAKTALGRGENDVIVELPKEFGQIDSKGHPSGNLVMYYDESDQQLAQTFAGVMEAILDEINQQFVPFDPPLKLERRTLQTTNLTQFDYVFSGLLAFSIMSLGIFGLANGLPADKKTGVLRRLRATPLTASQLVLATGFEYMLIGLASLGLMFVAGLVIFDFNMRGDYFNFTLFSALGIIMMFGFGLAIGGWAKNENQAAPVANLVAFPLMFLSGVFFPRFLMPEWLQGISAYLPLAPVVDGLRLITTESKTVLDLGPELAIIGAWTIGIYLMAVKLFRWE
jgi:ABC-2 type transport system permease protein